MRRLTAVTVLAAALMGAGTGLAAGHMEAADNPDPTYCSSHGGTDGPATGTFHQAHDGLNGVNEAAGKPLGDDQPGETLHNGVEPLTCSPAQAPQPPAIPLG